MLDKTITQRNQLYEAYLQHKKQEEEEKLRQVEREMYNRVKDMAPSQLLNPSADIAQNSQFTNLRAQV